MTEKEFSKLLSAEGIPFDEQKEEKLRTYYELLIEWNKIMNLTAITEKKDVYLKHFYDSLTIARVIDLNVHCTICDVGTGAGFPGIVLKIFYPNIKLVLVDSLKKRVSFLNYVIKKLSLKDIECIHVRVEDYGKTNREKFDIVVARALAPLNILLEYLTPLVKVKGNVIVMKADSKKEEENAKRAINTLQVKEIKRCEFLLYNGEMKRTIINYLKISNSPGKYPRNPLEIKKKPL